MCELFTIGATTASAGVAASAGVTITVMDLLGVAASAMSGMAMQQQAQAQKQQARYQAQVARNNQIIANQQAADAFLRGRQDERAYRQRVKTFAGKQRSNLAASGFAANEDDALDILADTAQVGASDALRVRSNAAREAWQHQVAATNQQAQAGLFDTKARSYRPGQAGAMGFASGMAGVADKWTARNTGRNFFGLKVS